MLAQMRKVLFLLSVVFLGVHGNKPLQTTEIDADGNVNMRHIGAHAQTTKDDDQQQDGSGAMEEQYTMGEKLDSKVETAAERNTEAAPVQDEQQDSFVQEHQEQEKEEEDS